MHKNITQGIMDFLLNLKKSTSFLKIVINMLMVPLHNLYMIINNSNSNRKSNMNN